MEYNLKKVVEILENLNTSEDEILKIITEINKLAFTKFYSEAMLSFQDEDFNEIENCQTQDQANEVIMELYQKRTGKNAQFEMNKFFSDFAKGFILQYQKEHPDKS